MITSYFAYIIEASICLSLFYSFYFFVLRKENFFQLNRAYLLGTLILTLLIPSWDFTWSTSLMPLHSIDIEEVLHENLSEELPSVYNFETGILIIYFIGALVATIKALLSLAYILRLRFKNSVQRKEEYLLVNITEPHSVFSFWNIIFWNQDLNYTEQEREQILRHELVHIRQKHSFDNLFLLLINILFWFNPFVYWYKRSLGTTHEFIADYNLFQKQNYQMNYVDLLMKEAKAQHGYSLPIVHMFFNDQLYSRLKMIKESDNKSNRIRLLAFVPMALLTISFFCFNPKTVASYYDNGAMWDPEPGSIFQSCEIDKNGMITLIDGRKVTVDEMKNIVAERRRAEGKPVPIDKVFIISKEAMKKHVKTVPKSPSNK